MKRINYFTFCPCCGKEHIISLMYAIDSQLELDNRALFLCSCPAAVQMVEKDRAENLGKNGFLDLAKNARLAVEE